VLLQNFFLLHRPGKIIDTQEEKEIRGTRELPACRQVALQTSVRFFEGMDSRAKNTGQGEDEQEW